MSGTDFWNQVGTTNEDVERLYGFILERGAPVASGELVAHIIEWRVRDEERKLAELAARKSPLYQPKQTYAVGQSVIFTTLGNREGVIQAIRDGENPRIGSFQVMSVQLPDETESREFAMGYTSAHPLNVDQTQKAVSLGVTPEQAVLQYGTQVRAAIEKRLGTDKEFVRLGEEWFLKGLLPQIHEGYLNLAEAAIEQTGDAVRTGELVKMLDLAGAKKSAAIFALNAALAKDSRFEDLGSTGDPRWYLAHLIPAEAIERPRVLEIVGTRPVSLSGEMESIAAELLDEADANGVPSTQPVTPRAEITLVLTYPHRVAGTLPITPAVYGMIPAFTKPRLKLTLIDALTQDKIPGFAVRDGNYIAGLTQWFTSRKLSPGALITLKRGSDPLTLMIEYQPLRERSLWVRVARGTNGQLTFSQEKRPVSHKYDEEMLIVVGDPVSIERAAQNTRDHKLSGLLENIFPELAKLSGAGRVHAKTLYSAVNLIRRSSARAVLGALNESRSFTSVGGGYFVLNEVVR